MASLVGGNLIKGASFLPGFGQDSWGEDYDAFKASWEIIGSFYSHLSCEIVFVFSALLIIPAMTFVTERIHTLEAWNGGEVMNYL
jgi:hypothetical protein